MYLSIIKIQESNSPNFKSRCLYDFLQLSVFKLEVLTLNTFNLFTKFSDLSWRSNLRCITEFRLQQGKVQCTYDVDVTKKRACSLEYAEPLGYCIVDVQVPLQFTADDYAILVINLNTPFDPMWQGKETVLKVKVKRVTQSAD